MLDLQWALPVSSPSTTWESPTLAAPQSMETRHLGAPHRLTPTTTMSPELVPGATVMLPALSKRPLPPQQLLQLPQLLLDLLSLLLLEPASVASRVVLPMAVLLEVKRPRSMSTPGRLV